MREILFRAKNEDNGKWHYGDLRHYDEGTTIIAQCAGEYAFIDPDTVGQYTGLTDKDGKKIFEGDIVDVGGHGVMVNGLYRVIFCTANHCWAVERNPEHFHSYFTFLELNGFAETSEVIGNIHDNPELVTEDGRRCGKWP